MEESASSTSPEGADEDRRMAEEFMTQRPSDEERIQVVNKAVDILRHNYELGQKVRSEMNESLEWHGISFWGYGFYFNTLQPVMERDGMLLHASFVVDGPAAVSERERAACEKLLDYDAKMQSLVFDMREIDNNNNSRVREGGSRAVSQASEWLENIPKDIAGQQGVQRRHNVS
jgi:hypothetical protein